MAKEIRQQPFSIGVLRQGFGNIRKLGKLLGAHRSSLLLDPAHNTLDFPLTDLIVRRYGPLGYIEVKSIDQSIEADQVQSGYERDHIAGFSDPSGASGSMNVKLG